MDTFDVRLLDSTYSFVRRKLEDGTTEEETLVKLFGKTRDNESITIVCRGFDPYFHVFDPSAETKASLEKAEGVKKVEETTLEYKGRKERFVKVTVKAPWMMSRLRGDFELQHRNIHLISCTDDLLAQLRADPLGRVQDDGETLRIETDDRTNAVRLVNKYGLINHMEPAEAEKYAGKSVFFNSDIVFTNRFIYDHDLDACVRVSGHTYEDPEYTTDLVMRAEAFDRCEPFTPKLKILSFDIENSIKHKNLYCIGVVMLDQATGEKQKKAIASAHGVRTGEENPTVVEDLDAEEAKMLQEFVRTVQEWDPDVITGYNIDNYDWRVISERTRKLFVEEQENEKPISKILLLGRDGLGLNRRVNRTTFDVTWDVKGRILIDAWRSVKKELHPKRETLGFVSQVLLGDTKDNINNTKIDQEWAARRDEVITYCLKDADLTLDILLHKRINSIEKLMDIAVPAKLPAKEVGGGQNRMIESLLIRLVDREGVAVPTSGSEREEYEGGFVYPTKPGLHDWVIGLDFSSMYPSQIIKHNICFTTFTQNPAIAGHTCQETTAMFVPTEARPGIVPRMAQSLLDARKQAKANKKKAEAAGDKDLANYYDRLQASIKIISNATYGYFGTKFCRWPYAKFIAPSITAWAREEIKTVVTSLESRGYTVVAGDTDSVFFMGVTEDGKKLVGLEPCLALGKQVQEEFSVGNMHIELEKVMERYFTHAKKRYFGKIVWPKPDLLVRGYETRRTDSFDLQGETMTNVFNMVLDGMPYEAVSHAKTIVSMTLKGKVETGKLVISKNIMDESEYVNPESMVVVQVSRKLKERGHEFVPGMKTPFIITKGEAPMQAEPVIEGEEFTHKPDYSYYARRLARGLARITEPFGCDERTLMQGNSQKNLAAFFGE